LSFELAAAVKGEDWALVNSGIGMSGWPMRVFAMDKHYRCWRIRRSRPGIRLAGAIGAAHANQALGRFTVSIQATAT